MFGCCCCNLGAYVPRLKNVTQVRTQSDCTDPTTNATVTADGVNIPAARLDNTYDAAPGGPRVCSGGAKCGKCGGWLQIGDYNGLPAQEVTAGTDDIVAGATPDSTHYNLDNNAYEAYPNAAASFFQVGDIAKIVSIGTTDWTTMGASANTVGLIFTVTATGSGTGTAQLMTDMLMDRRRGGNWIFAQKYWHGRFGFLDNENGTLDPTKSPAQSKWRTIKVDFSFSVVNTDTDPATTFAGNLLISGTYISTIDRYSGKETRTITDFVLTQDRTYIAFDDHWNATFPVPFDNRWDASTAFLGYLNNFYARIPTSSDAAATNMVNFVQSSGYDSTALLQGFCNTFVPAGNTVTGSPFCRIDILQAPTASGSMSVTGNAVSASSASSGSGTVTVPPGNPNIGIFESDDTTASASITNTSLAMTMTLASVEDATGQTPAGYKKTMLTEASMTVTLLDEYTKAELETDFEAALAAWNMSDFARLNSLRMDENLAHAALCTYAEWQQAVSPTSPVFSSLSALPQNYTMDDLNAPVTDANGVPAFKTNVPSPTLPYIYDATVSGVWSPTWAGMIWTDPTDSIWKYPAGSTRTTGGFKDSFATQTAYAGAALITGILTGGVISHTAPTTGITDRHFWMGAVNYRREGSPIMYNAYSHGAYSDDSGFTDSTTENPAGTYFDGQLPTPTLRWMPPQNEKYDGAAGGTPPIGNFPQQFTDFSNGCLKGGKYCQAVQKWNAVDYLQPSGKRKFDVDQNTVGIIVAAGSGYFTVGKPSTTSAFPATGYIAVTGSIGVTGIYPVTGAATDNGDHTWNVPVGAKIEDFPTGVYTYGDLRDSSNWLGWLKWIGYTQYAQSFASAPGITGRVAVTTSYAAGVLTVNTTTAQPYFRVDPASNALRAVNLYDVNGSLLNGSPLVLARTDDSHFTATTSNYPTAVWMVDAALTWAQSGFTNASQNTGVHIKWQFDQRKANLATAAQPAWLNGTGAGVGDGVVGCLDSGYSIEQFNYLNGSCPAIVGIVPSGSPENFGTQVLFDFPTVPIDNGYGAHSQSFIGLTMEDPFEIACGTPFKPDFNPMDYTTPLSFSWKEDDGSGKSDDGGATPPVYYYAMRPLVEAADAVPSGKSLPIGVTLFFDPANKFPPPCYPNGILYGATVTSDWKTTERICNNVSRFVADYAAWSFCP